MDRCSPESAAQSQPTSLPCLEGPTAEYGVSTNREGHEFSQDRLLDARTGGWLMLGLSRRAPRMADRRFTV